MEPIQHDSIYKKKAWDNLYTMHQYTTEYMADDDLSYTEHLHNRIAHAMREPKEALRRLKAVSNQWAAAQADIPGDEFRAGVTRLENEISKIEQP